MEAEPSARGSLQGSREGVMEVRTACLVRRALFNPGLTISFCASNSGVFLSFSYLWRLARLGKPFASSLQPCLLVAAVWGNYMGLTPGKLLSLIS